MPAVPLGAKLVGAVRFEKCDGPRLALQLQQLQQKGHSLCVAQGEGMPIKYCSRCGAWSTRRAFNLAKDCPRTPTAAGRQALARIARGRHPWLAVGQRVEDRGFIQTTVEAEDNARGGEARLAREPPGDGGGDVPMPPGSSSDDQGPEAGDAAEDHGRGADEMDVTDAAQGDARSCRPDGHSDALAERTTREQSTSAGTTAPNTDQRPRTMGSQDALRPTREQTHHRLLQSMA